MSEAKPRLVWVTEHDDDSDYLSVMERLDTQGVYEGVTVCRLHDEAAADLIADAGTVFNTTGLTPSQLLERVKELEEALRGLDDAYCRAGSPLTREERFEDRKRLIAARAALSKARPNTAEGEAQAAPTAADFTTLGAAMRAIQQAIELIGEPADDRMRAVKRVLRGAVIVAEDSGALAGLRSIQSTYVLHAAPTPAAAKEPSP